MVIGFLAVRPADGIAILGLDVGRQGRRTVHAQSHVVEFVDSKAHGVLGSIGHVDGIVFGVLEIAAVAVSIHVGCLSSPGDIDGILIGAVIVLIVILVFCRHDLDDFIAVGTGTLDAHFFFSHDRRAGNAGKGSSQHDEILEFHNDHSFMVDAEKELSSEDSSCNTPYYYIIFFIFGHGISALSARFAAGRRKYNQPLRPIGPALLTESLLFTSRGLLEAMLST